MKKDIHPQYFPNATVRCACGAVFTLGATKPEMEVEICSQCHPFYTGKFKIMDVAGRVEKFKAKVEKVQVVKTGRSGSRKEKRAKKQATRVARAKSVTVPLAKSSSKAKAKSVKKAK